MKRFKNSSNAIRSCLRLMVENDAIQRRIRRLCSVKGLFESFHGRDRRNFKPVKHGAEQRGRSIGGGADQNSRGAWLHETSLNSLNSQLCLGVVSVTLKSQSCQTYLL
jgi:Arc/MetJ-type ribon-helix-helix transcriptional regulator